MKQSKFSMDGNKPEIEINKPGDVKFWQRPNVSLVLYLLFLAGMWFMWQSASQLAQEEIPYSQFLKYLEQDQVEKAVVTENLILGSLMIKDAKSGKPRAFATVPLPNNELARMMEKHGVEYTVRHETHWLSSVLGWVVPIAVRARFSKNCGRHSMPLPGCCRKRRS